MVLSVLILPKGYDMKYLERIKKGVLLFDGAIGTTLFKKFSSLDYISKNVFIIAIVASSIALITFMVIVHKVIQLLYSESY